MVRWRNLQHLSGIGVNFCEAHHRWQRPRNENFNGPARRWLPKGTDLTVHCRDRLDAFSHQINDMPRRSLGWTTAAKTYSRLTND